MVYNVWTLWINGLQRVDIMDKFVELHLCMVIPMVPVDEYFKLKGLRCVVSLYYKTLFFTIALVVIE